MGESIGAPATAVNIVTAAANARLRGARPFAPLRVTAQARHSEQGEASGAMKRPHGKGDALPPAQDGLVVQHVDEDGGDSALRPAPRGCPPGGPPAGTRMWAPPSCHSSPLTSLTMPSTAKTSSSPGERMIL